MYIVDLPDKESLEPEQENIIDRATAPDLYDPIMLIQGVAGSGKSTIALSILRAFLTSNKEVIEQGTTPVMITYNNALVSDGHDKLVKAINKELGVERIPQLNKAEDIESKNVFGRGNDEDT